MKTVTGISPRVYLMTGVAALIAPFLLLPVLPLVSVGIGLAGAHLWLLNFGQPKSWEPTGAPLHTMSMAMAGSGMVWLMVGMMILAKAGG